MRRGLASLLASHFWIINISPREKRAWIGSSDAQPLSYGHSCKTKLGSALQPWEAVSPSYYPVSSLRAEATLLHF